MLKWLMGKWHRIARYCTHCGFLPVARQGENCTQTGVQSGVWFNKKRTLLDWLELPDCPTQLVKISLLVSETTRKFLFQ